MRIKLVPISFLALLPCIREAFDGDIPLQSHYHISPGDIDHISTHTYESLAEWIEEYQLDCYAVVAESDDEVENIGYTVLLNDQYNIMISYGISIAHRTPPILKMWLAAVEKEFGGKYGVSMWQKNTRSANFFKKNGFNEEKVIESETNEKMVLLWQR